MIPDWYAWTLIAVVGLAAAAAVVAALRWPRRSEWLPIEHGAAAALIGVTGWEMLVELPGSISQFFAIGAGLPNAPVTPFQIFVIANVAFVLASAAAIAGILRRSAWGAVLGIGVSVARVAMGLLGVVSLLTLLGADGLPEGQLGWLVLSTAVRVVPALAAIVLLALPFWRVRRSPHPADPEGIIELDPDAGIDDAATLVVPTP